MVVYRYCCAGSNRNRPDIVCLAGAESAGREISRIAAIERWLRRDLARAEELEWSRDLGEGQRPEETRRALPGDPEDSHSRYIEATVDGISLVGCLYLPNGNPAPGPKFDYKLALVLNDCTKHAKKLSLGVKPRSSWQVTTTSSLPT